MSQKHNSKTDKAQKRSNDKDLQKIEDPENYNLKRRLRQIHDAREEVVSVKQEAFKRDMINNRRARRAIAEAVVDYIQELLPTLELAGASEKFLNETIEYDINFEPDSEKRSILHTGKMVKQLADTEENDTITIARLVKNRGLVEPNNDSGLFGSSSEPLNYNASMRVWQICNRYFEQIAGPKFADNNGTVSIRDEQ